MSIRRKPYTSECPACNEPTSSRKLKEHYMDSNHFKVQCSTCIVSTDQLPGSLRELMNTEQSHKYRTWREHIIHVQKDHCVMNLTSTNLKKHVHNYMCQFCNTVLASETRLTPHLQSIFCRNQREELENRDSQ